MEYDSLVQFKYVSEPAITVQKLLNQWKHKYDMEILMYEFALKHGDPPTKYINMMIARRPKNG